MAETDFPDTVTSPWNGSCTLENDKLVVKGMRRNRILRPGDATEIGLCATRPARLVVTGDWGSGYCAKVAVANTSTVKALRWSVQLPVQARRAACGTASTP